ncbi:hypothetical protein Hanom_Chr07g00592971 [Helianthus anomalus]
MFTPNCRRYPLALKLTGFVLNVTKSFTLCPLGQTQVMCHAHEDIFVISSLQRLFRNTIMFRD